MLPQLAWILIFSALFNISKCTTVSKPGCAANCGSLTVPYPFGIGRGCGLDQHFELNCTAAHGPPRALIKNLQVHEISNNHIRVSNVITTVCHSNTTEPAPTNYSSIDITGTPYSYSDLNKFTVVGCEFSGEITSSSGFDSACMTICVSPDDVFRGNCSGRACCQVSLPRGQKFYSMDLISMATTPLEVPSNSGCNHAFFGENDRFVYNGSDFSDRGFVKWVEDTVPLVLDWSIGNSTCAEVESSEDYVCKGNSNCVDFGTEWGGYRCNCTEGYHGNPYLESGCTDIDECADPKLNDCEVSCINTAGSFNCSCLDGQFGDGRRNGSGCTANQSEFPVIKVALGVGFGFLSIVLSITWLYFYIKKRELLKLREKFFQQNGGFLLKQQLSLKEDSNYTESTKIFSAKELEKATNNYADDRILGRGGSGTVYKGILLDKTIVAIKKPRDIDETQIEQFINEVVILTQTNHRNVVKCLGCCLEYEVPLLVYEYVSKGTLSEHIYNKGGATNWLSWEDRLRIASEVASALSYLHSAVSIPIIHGDMKSANILLDEYYTAKVSDFGASRLIPLDQTRVTTMVVGTFGYLDPEYFHSSQLTEKSDVYSFGVVLVELLTGQKPVDMERNEEQRYLTTTFITAIAQNRLFQMLEPRVVREGSFEQLQAMADLIKRCLQVNREDRPTMREVAAEILGLRKHSWTYQPVSDQGYMDEAPSADLYTVSSSTNSYDTTGEFSGQYTLSSNTSLI